MALPSLTEDVTGADLLALVENIDVINGYLMMHREEEGIPPGAPVQPEEIEWIEQVIRQRLQKGLLLKLAIEQLPPDDIIDLWMKKTNRQWRKGRKHTNTLLYNLAWGHHTKFNKSAMEVYKEMILPYLIKTGQIPTDDMGDPDPYQEQSARKSFLRAMARRRKTQE